MNPPCLEVAPLHRVEVQVSAGRSDHCMDLTPEPVVATFILGLASRGLTPIEQEILGRHPGDTLSFSVGLSDWHEMMGHVCLLPYPPPLDADPVYFRIRIVSTHPADQREVIRSLASLVNEGGCGGGCGCGCGC